MCASSLKLGFLGAGYLTAQAIFFLVFLKVVPMFGLRIVWQMTVLIQLLLYGILQASPYYSVTMLAMIFSGAVSGRFAFSYVYLGDLLHSKHLSAVTAVFQGLDALTIAFWSLYFRYISNNYRYFFSFVCLILLGVLFLARFFLVESPSYLFQNGKKEQAKSIFVRIAAFNKKDPAEVRSIIDRSELG